jgi:hypothetical protein
MARATKLHALASGLKSFVPWIGQYRGTGGSTSALYCYTVWWRHLGIIAEAGALRPLRSVVELGPGDSLGVSLAALLAGADRVTALDVIAHNEPDRDVRVFAELDALFSARADVPGDDTVPGVFPAAPRTAFPEATLAAISTTPMTDDRRARIRAAIARRDGAGDLLLRYMCPWTTASLPPASVDLLVTQAVLQDVGNGRNLQPIEDMFLAMSTWLAPGGLMSHQIDLSAPIGDAWNDHWTMGDWSWRLTCGKRPFFFNRLPVSGYLGLCERYGFDVLRATPVIDRTGRGRDEVAPRFRALPDQDFVTRGVHLLARRRG